MRSVSVTFILISLIISSDLSAENNSFLFKPDGADFYIYGYRNNSFIINRSKFTGFNLDKQLTQLSSGKRINTASDDPAGFAIAEKMNALLIQLKQESINAEDMRNMHNFIESAVAQDQELLQRIRLLIVRASNGILNSEDLENIQAEINQFLNQVNMNAKFLQFNSKIIIPELTTANLGIDNIDVIHKINEAIKSIDDALIKLTMKRVLQGVKSNILTFQIEGKAYQYLNLQRSESNISDLDIAEGITELFKNSVKLKTQNGLLLRSK